MIISRVPKIVIASFNLEKFQFVLTLVIAHSRNGCRGLSLWFFLKSLICAEVDSIMRWLRAFVLQCSCRNTILKKIVFVLLCLALLSRLVVDSQDPPILLLQQCRVPLVCLM